MGGMPLEEQNKAWVKFIEKNENQLAALFPEAQFLKMKNFGDVQNKALQEINETAETLVDLENN